MNVDGTGVANLSNNPAIDDYPNWGPEEEPYTGYYK